MTASPALLVAGLGRCGTSLMMQMLAAAGLPCVGEFPAYEVEELDHQEPPLAWLEAQRGKAMKVLNPHLTRIPPEFEAPVIWLDRNPKEQAESQAKFARYFFGDLSITGPHRKRWIKGLREDRAECLRGFRGRPLLGVRFEGLIHQTNFSVLQISAFLAYWWCLSPERMASAVRPRPSGAACAPNLAMELALVAEAEAGGG